MLENRRKGFAILTSLVAVAGCLFVLNYSKITSDVSDTKALSSANMELTYSINESDPASWRVAPELDPDELSVECFEDRVTSVKFQSTTATVELEVSGTAFEDFVVELADGQRAKTRVQCIPEQKKFRGDYATGMSNRRDYRFDLNSGTLDAHIQQVIVARKIPGAAIAVVQGEEVLYQKVYGLSDLKSRTVMTEDTPMRLASATKFISGLVFLSLAEDGVIDLDKTLGDYLPNLQDDWDAIPLWRLLNHSSGLPTLSGTSLSGASKEEMNALSPKDIFTALVTLPLDFEPGSRGRYQQEAYAILAYIAERETGLTWPDLVQQHVFDPAGIEDAYFGDSLTQHPASYTYASGKVAPESYYYPRGIHMSGGLNLSANDISRLFKALSRDVIVSREFYANEVFSDARLPDGVGYSLAAIVNLEGSIRSSGHEGGAGVANIRYAPGLGIGVAVFTNLNAKNAAQDISAEITELLFNPPNLKTE